MTSLQDLPVGFAASVAFVLGAMIGSFLNVVIHRLPRNESLVRPASRCPSCGEPIRPWTNIPILSYVLLRGRCASCEASISPRYPLVEALTGALFVALLFRYGLGARLLVDWALVSALIAVIFIDAEHQIIPNGITVPGVPLGLLCAWWLPAAPGLLDAVLGIVLVAGMMWAISAAYEWWTGRIGLGMGDVKLVALLASFLGLQGALGVVVLGSVAGLGQAIVMIVFLKAGRLTRIPFGPALAGAGILHVFVPQIVPLLLGQT